MHVTRDTDTTFKVKRSKVNLQGAGAYCRGLPHSLFSNGTKEKLLLQHRRHHTYAIRHHFNNTRSSADAFGGQSKSPNIVPFHMVRILSSCAIVTLSLRHARFSDIRLQKCDLEIRVRGHSMSLSTIR